MSRADKIKGCFLLGACGDALGAPVEGVRNLEKFITLHGPDGLAEILPFKNAYGKGVDYPAGRVTDDTTMLVTTAAALTLAGPGAGTEELRRFLWQGYLNWVLAQEEGAGAARNIDASIGWTENTRAFWFSCGGGRGTIAALLQDRPGSVADPLSYACTVGGKAVEGPGRGCGGMMRVAPVGFLDAPPERIFELGCESAAVTHGHPPAYVAAGAVALYVHFAAQDMAMEDVVEKTKDVLRAYESRPPWDTGVKACLAAMDRAQQHGRETPRDMRTMDALPAGLGYGSPFDAVPVLAQVTYALCGAGAGAGNGDVKAALVLSVSHGGDSDSVGAITGNVLGARHGTACIPQEWLEKIGQAAEIGAAAADFSRVFVKAPAAAPKRNVPPRP